MAKDVQQLQAILDYTYMYCTCVYEEGEESTSTVHTHAPNGTVGANQRPMNAANTRPYIQA